MSSNVHLGTIRTTQPSQTHKKTIRDHDGSLCATSWQTSVGGQQKPWWTIQIYTIIHTPNDDFELAARHVGKLAGILEDQYFGREHAGRGGALQVYDRLEVHSPHVSAQASEDKIMQTCMNH